jgi:DNA cross-link repair 1C protein
MCGNTPHPGCLTSDVNVRLHSCEKGKLCEVAQRPTTVSIQPIIAHLPTGEDLAEVGVGGGGDDLQQEAELEFLDQASLATLFNTFVHYITFAGSMLIMNPRALSSSASSTDMSDILKGALEKIVSTGRNIPLDWDIGTLNAHSAEEVIIMLVDRLRKNPKNQKRHDECSLPSTIYFPYSRHSSLPELCHFVEAFRPLDVWPCTVNPAEWLKNGKYCI